MVSCRDDLLVRVILVHLVRIRGLIPDDHLAGCVIFLDGTAQDFVPTWGIRPCKMRTLGPSALRCVIMVCVHRLMPIRGNFQQLRRT